MRIDLERARKMAELTANIVGKAELQGDRVRVVFASREWIEGPIVAAMSDADSDSAVVLVLDDDQIMAACDDFTAQDLPRVSRRYEQLAQTSAENLVIAAAIEKLAAHLADDDAGEAFENSLATLQARAAAKDIGAGIGDDTEDADTVSAEADTDDTEGGSERMIIEAELDTEAYLREVCGEFYDA